MSTLPEEVAEPTTPISSDEHQHPTDHSGDEDAVEQIDIEDEWGMLQAGSVVAQPSRREIRRGVRMTTLTCAEQVLLYDSALWVIDLTHVMHPVTVDANRFICLLLGRELFKKNDCRPVEVGDIGFKDVCADIITTHELFICVAFCANLGGEKTEGARRWTFNIMDTMAVDAGRHIGVPFTDQCRAVHALLIPVVDLRMAALTSLRDFASGLLGGSDVVRAVAIGAHGGFEIAGCQRFLMDAVQRGVVFILVALCARGI
jgi:hypothetical protein